MTTEPTTLDLDALERVAEAATPGPWGSDSDEIAPIINGELSWQHEVAAVVSDVRENTRYITTFDPPTVKTLITALRAERARVAELERALLSITNLDGDAFDRAEGAQIIAHKALCDLEEPHLSWEATDHDG